MESSKETKEANVSFAFSKSSDMPDGLKVKAIMDSTTSVIQIQLNANEEFGSLDELNTEINNAITEAYGGEHPGGTFTFDVKPDPFEAGALKGSEIVDTAASEYEGGGLEKTADTAWPEGFNFSETGVKFTGSGDATVKVEWDANAKEFTVTVETAGTTPAGGGAATGKATYVGKISWERAMASKGGNKVMLTNTDGNADPNDTITITYPNASKMGTLDATTPDDPTKIGRAHV